MKRVCVRLYNLLLDIHNKDVMAEQIAAALKGERRLYLTIGQKAFATVMALLLATDTLVHILKL